MTESAICLKGVRKKYRLFESPRDRLKEALHPFKKHYHSPFWALNGIDLDVPKHQVLGVLGRNGSGKSTLLQVVAGILRPTEGRVEIQGRIAALLELGAGFNPQFTGRDNVLLYSAIAGVPRGEVLAKMDRIEAFADIGKFFDQPVMTYSSGMYVRVAFAAAIHVDPDILIVDEALAVGDAQFQHKCYRRLRELREVGTTILFVTHSTDTVVQLCDRAVLMEAGQIVLDGEPRPVAEEYIRRLFGPKQAPTDDVWADGNLVVGALGLDSDAELSPNKDAWLDGEGRLADQISRHPLYNPGETRYGSGEAELADFRMLTDGIPDRAAITGHTPVDLFLKVYYRARVERPVIGFSLKTKQGVSIYGSNTFIEQISVPAAKAGSTHIYRFRFAARLNVGDYFLDLGVCRDNGTTGGEPVDVRLSVANFSVMATHRFSRDGLIDLDPQFDVLR